MQALLSMPRTKFVTLVFKSSSSWSLVTLDRELLSSYFGAFPISISSFSVVQL